MKTGITSSLKLIGRSLAASLTVTGTLTVLPPNSTVRVVAPSASGVRRFLSSVARAGLASVALASAVTSRVRPSAKVAWTTKSCLLRLVARVTSGGETSRVARTGGGGGGGTGGGAGG